MRRLFRRLRFRFRHGHWPSYRDLALDSHPTLYWQAERLEEWDRRLAEIMAEGIPEGIPEEVARDHVNLEFLVLYGYAIIKRERAQES